MKIVENWSLSELKKMMNYPNASKQDSSFITIPANTSAAIFAEKPIAKYGETFMFTQNIT